MRLGEGERESTYDWFGHWDGKKDLGGGGNQAERVDCFARRWSEAEALSCEIGIASDVCACYFDSARMKR